MTTAYPSGLDTLTNPTSSNNLNDAGVLHADQHTNANDAIHAIEAELGTLPKGSFASVRARLDSLAGKNWLSGIWGLPGVAMTSSISNESTTVNTLYMVPFFVSAPATVTDLAISVGTAGTASTSARLGVYSKDSSGSSWTLVNDTGTVAIDTTGEKQINSLSIALPASGLYGVSVLCQSACSLNSRQSGLSFYGPQGSTAFSTNLSVYLSVAQTYGALPSTASPVPGGGFSVSVYRAMVKLA